ncbi:DUF3617 family protein [Phenylobacterium sp.]|uniref:DUF3617 domain-containing protein n=1 Tax=Phenylobacterium sp. TaxID=1871053 RepID=UPI00120C44ED|nr:DUF3617 family protein [Phenylobacterium sp.]THD58202.1 MAG: DUF3617 family protein [Phenylobacterium sp.]
MFRYIAPMIAVVAVAAASSAAGAVLMRQAGEWQTSIDNGPPRLICYTTDETIDQNYVSRSMAKLPGANCKVSNFTTIGPVTSYSMQCTVGGSLMTTTGSITVTGPESVTGKAHSHGGMMKTANGQSVAVPDTDIVSVSRRLGPCKPGDKQVN